MASDFPLPDLIQSDSKQAEQGKRYQFYSGACYLLHARSAALQGASGLTVKFFTSEDPDNLLADEQKAILSVPDARNTYSGAPDLYFPHGIYIEVDGVSGNTDVALVEADWVPREVYCRAYPQVADTLRECWESAPGRSGTPWLDNFDPGDPDDGDWDNEGAAGSGGSAGGGATDIYALTDYKVTVGASSFNTAQAVSLLRPPAGTLSEVRLAITRDIALNAGHYWEFKLLRNTTPLQSTVFDTSATSTTAGDFFDLNVDQNLTFDGTQTLIVEIRSISDGTQPVSLNGHNLTFQSVFTPS